ncbi:MAG: hypothetical protein AB7V50_00825, partial [Vampirovibrionia bacterium]
LGLAITKQLVDAHRGEIRVESELNKGSKFCLILPVAEQKNIFILELDNKLQQSKQNHSSLTLLTLKRQSNKPLKQIDELSNQIVNMFRKDDKSTFLIEDNIIKIILSNTDKTAAQNVLKRIKKQCIKFNKPDFDDLILGIAIYPDDAIDSDELINLSLKSSVPVF